MEPPRSTAEGTARHAAYRATAYRVDAPAGGFEIRIDAFCPPLDGLLDRSGAGCWAWVTAHNPGGRLRDAERNLADQCRLEARVEQLGVTAIRGRSIAAAGAWPSEESLLILGMAREAAIALARDFGQEALVVGVRGAPAELVFC